MDTLEEWATDAGFTARVVADYDAESPREWDNLATLVQVDPGYIEPDGPSDVSDSVMDAWDRWRDVDTVARYLRLFHDAAAVDSWDATGPAAFNHGHVIAFVTREAMDRDWGRGQWTRVDAARVVSGELGTYRQWCEGEVYGVVVTDDDTGNEWSTWGIYTVDGRTDDPYLRDVAEDCAAEVEYQNDQDRKAAAERIRQRVINAGKVWATLVQAS